MITQYIYGFTVCIFALILILYGVAMECDRRYGGFQQSRLQYFTTPYHYIVGPNNSLIRFVDRNNIKKIYHDVDSIFPWAARFKAEYTNIRREALKVLELGNIPKFHELDSEYNDISAHDPSREWRTFVLKFYSEMNAKALEVCPVTSALVESVPEIHAAMFSILDPGFHIPPHRGPSTAALRYHLGIVIPEDGECFIEVGGERYDWKNGEDVVFDDTFEHHVYNNTTGKRIVLFCDVARPLPAWLMCLEDKLMRSRGVRAYFSKYNQATEKVVRIV